eukprot:GILI01001266.1.p1 GENE.GILI01001266.1~~GILI01001266.1.p1  ORF type:complete len:365 (+),score=102.28 GILI01001266.1:337-1431(+)
MRVPPVALSLESTTITTITTTNTVSSPSLENSSGNVNNNANPVNANPPYSAFNSDQEHEQHTAPAPGSDVCGEYWEDLCDLLNNLYEEDEVEKVETNAVCNYKSYTYSYGSFADKLAVWIGKDFLLRCSIPYKMQTESAVVDLTQPHFLVTFFEPLTDLQSFQLSTGALKIFSDPNAGGNSINSEALSFEVLRRLLGVKLLQTEMEIQYMYSEWKKTDYTVTYAGSTVGVSVTRAYAHKREFNEEDALMLLKKKLHGVNVSSQGVTPRHKWLKQILHIWCPSYEVAETLENVYAHQLSPELKSNTVIIVTVSKNSEWIYHNSAATYKLPESVPSVGAAASPCVKLVSSSSSNNVYNNCSTVCVS